MGAPFRDVMQVMDTVEKLSAAEESSREGLRQATCAVYRDQGLSVPSHLIEQALDVYEAKGTGPVSMAAKPSTQARSPNEEEDFDEEPAHVCAGPPLVDVLMVMMIIVFACFRAFAVYQKAQAKIQTQEDVQNLSAMTLQSPSANAHNTAASGKIQDWRLDRAAHGEEVHVRPNVQNARWSDIEFVGLREKTCAILAQDARFQLTMIQDSTTAPPPMSVENCWKHPGSLAVLHRVR